jgi:nitrate/nitrite transport system substrate-binding protein
VRQAENKEEMCKIISKREWFKVPAKDIVERAQGKFDYGNGKVVENSPHLMKFWAENASYPFKSHDLWFLTEIFAGAISLRILTRRSWLMQLTAKICGKKQAKAIGQEAAIPKSTSRGVETFFDGVKFDPEDPSAYLKSLKIKKV